MGIYNTTVGGNSLPATAGNGVGQNVGRHSPSDACHNSTNTKVLDDVYFELKRDSSVITSLKIHGSQFRLRVVQKQTHWKEAINQEQLLLLLLVGFLFIEVLAQL